MKIITIIVTYNSQGTIEDCLTSILRQKVPIEVVVVDNHSSDNTVKTVKDLSKQIRVIQLNENTGFAKGNNLGIEFALTLKPNYILITNPDTWLKKDCLEELVHFAQKRNNRGLFGPLIFADRQMKTIWSAGGSLDKKRFTAKLIHHGILASKLQNQPEVAKCDFVSGTCMLIPTNVLKQGCRFYQPYFMYYEDVEFCWRVGKLGYQPFCVTKAKIVHQETSQAGKYLAQKKYYLARNHLLFIERNALFALKLREFLRLPKTIIEHQQQQDVMALNGIKDYWLRKFGPTNTKLI